MTQTGITKGNSPQDLLRVLDLERIEDNLYLGQNEYRPNFRLFGGQVLAQALAAARQTIADETASDHTPAGGEMARPVPDTPQQDRECHSLHGYFLRPGDTRVPVLYKVEPIRDGKSFSTRRIVGVQKGEAIFSMDVSFQIAEQSPSHQLDMPRLPDPDSLEDDNAIALKDPKATTWETRERPFHFRSIYQSERPPADEMQYPVWLKFREALPDTPALHQYLLAYASDMGFLATSYLPHRGKVNRDSIQMASLDHAMWFHRDFRVDEWILYLKETTNAGGSRNFNRGLFYNQQGTLIASAMQEGLMRVRN